MKSFQRSRRVYLPLLSIAVLALISCSCRPRIQSASSTTASNSTAAPSYYTNTTSASTLAGDLADLEVRLSDERAAPDVAPPARIAPGLRIVRIDLDLPAPAFKGTPVPSKEPNVQPPRGKPRGPLFAPEGTVNLARGKPVACSDPVPAAGELDYVTDGNKEASDFSYLELRPGTEWVQVDLQQRATIYAALVWHNHAQARVYRDVILQVSDDPDFLDSQTFFNNDYDNSSGMEIGQDMGYVETSEGKLIDCQGVEARYVRIYSNGNHIDAANDDDKNHYVELEVYGRPLE